IMASSVELEPAPAITGTRPLACSTQSSITRACSSWLRVGDSPVVPQGTSPWVPSAICQSTRARKASSSTLPFLNGVTSAVREPLMRSRTLLSEVRGMALPISFWPVSFWHVKCGLAHYCRLFGDHYGLVHSFPSKLSSKLSGVFQQAPAAGYRPCLPCVPCFS